MRALDPEYITVVVKPIALKLVGYNKCNSRRKLLYRGALHCPHSTVVIKPKKYSLQQIKRHPSVYTASQKHKSTFSPCVCNEPIFDCQPLMYIFQILAEAPKTSKFGRKRCQKKCKDMILKLQSEFFSKLFCCT